MLELRTHLVTAKSTFTWSDCVVVARAQKIHPLAPVARVACLLRELYYQAEEHSNDPGYTLLGFTQAVEALAKAGDYDTIGMLLSGLESVVDSGCRNNWPLDAELRQGMFF